MPLLDAIIKHQKRIWITIGALVLFRIGTFIPIPGIDLDSLHGMYRFAENNTAAMRIIVYHPIIGARFTDSLVGGALSRLSIFALGILPYAFALFIVRGLALAIGCLTGGKPVFERWKYPDLACTSVIAAVSGLAIANVLLDPFYGLSHIVTIPGHWFYLATALTMVCGTLIVVWLCNTITKFGIGSGISVLIFAGISAYLPQLFELLRYLSRFSPYPLISLLFYVVVLAAVVTFGILLQRAERTIVVAPLHPPRSSSRRPSVAPHVVLRLNAFGAMPIVIVLAIMLLPPGGWSLNAVPYILAAHWQGVYFLNAWISAAEILLICLSAFVLVKSCTNPKQVADTLSANGMLIPGILPGSATRSFLHRKSAILAIPGTIYLVGLYLLSGVLWDPLSFLLDYWQSINVLIAAIIAHDLMRRLTIGYDSPLPKSADGLPGSVELETRNN